MMWLLLACHGGSAESTDTPDSTGGTSTPTGSETATPPATRSLRVHVTLDGVPAGGVSVLQGGNPARWTTDAAGEATVTVDFGVTGDIYVMASAEDARIEGALVGADTPEPLEIALVRFSRADNPAYVFQDPGEGDPVMSNSGVCLHCHISLHGQWWASPHRTAASNPTVHDLYQGTARALSELQCLGTGGSWEPAVVPGSALSTPACHKGAGVLPDTDGYGGCADCHAPGIDGALGGRDLLDAKGVAFDYGVHCDVCHKIEAVTPGAAPGLGGAITLLRPPEPSSSPVFGDWEPLTFGPYDDVPNPRMGSVHRELFHSATLCAGCHQDEQPVLVSAGTIDLARWPSGTLPIHTTFAEWEASPFNPSAPCQSCHMPPDPAPASAADLYNGHEKAQDGGLIGVATGWERPPGSVRQHAWFGPRQPESGMLQLAASVDVAPSVEGDELTAAVTVVNVGPGHALPTGEPLRAVFVTVAATCEGTPLEAVGGDALPDWAGWLDRRSDASTWPGAAVGDVVRVVRRTGAWVDYVGFGPFGDGTFSAAEKGLAGEELVGEATVTAVDGDAVTFSTPLPAGDVAYRTRGVVTAGAPGWAFARVLADATGAVMVPHFAAVDVVSDNRLLPQARWTSTHRFRASCAHPEVTATVWHRNYPVALAAERGWPVTDQVMATSTRVAP